MRFKGLDLNLLVALDALLELRNVSAAADRLCLSQSAMSNALGRLRDYFQDELLAHSGRTMILTPRAYKLVEPTRNVLMEISGQITQPAQFDPFTYEGEFRISSCDYLQDLLFTKLTRVLAYEAPNIKIKLIPVSKYSIHQLNSGDIELIACMDDYLSDNHPKSKLLNDEYVMISWEKNQYCRQGISRKYFNLLNHVDVSFCTSSTHSYIDSYLKKIKVNRKISAVTTIFSALPKMIIETNYLATILKYQAEQLVKIYPIKIHDHPFPIPKAHMSLQWHYMRRDEAILWLAEKIKSLANEVGKENNTPYLHKTDITSTPISSCSRPEPCDRL